MKQKGFAPILILILIALVAAGYFGFRAYHYLFDLTEKGGPTAPPVDHFHP